ncbi:DUF2213 domain-containing protein [Xanthobacter sediminis]
MEFCDFAQLAGTRRTADGYLVAEVRAARTGIQQYQGRELGRPDLGIVNVLRPEAVVFAKDSLATYAGKPVTLGHPPESVKAENWKRYAVGDIGADIARDGEFVRVPLKLMDADAIAAVLGGTREISMGYTTDIRWESGTTPDGQTYDAVQTGPLRINHLAIVSKARGGAALRFGDAAVPVSDHGASNMADGVPPGFFRDAYGRVLVSGATSGDDRADGRALAARLLYEQDLRDAHKADDAEPADAVVNAGSFTKKGADYGEVPEVRAVREQYERDISNAWRETDPAPPARSVAYGGGGKRRELA